ncbi:MAG: hypothetical protein RBU21_17400 [FCB group bacterium]|jgi:hypothetical protein|nr:hypothetical protein [FCB group bacterium]
MQSSSYLFSDMSDEPQPAKPVRRRRTQMSALPPGLRAALEGLKHTINTIPDAEWEVRRQQWNALQREIKKGRVMPEDEEPPRRRSAALDPTKRT